MTIVEWANVALPLLALGVGMCLVMMNPEAIDAGVERLDAWWRENVVARKRRRNCTGKPTLG